MRTRICSIYARLKTHIFGSSSPASLPYPVSIELMDTSCLRLALPHLLCPHFLSPHPALAAWHPHSDSRSIWRTPLLPTPATEERYINYGPGGRIVAENDNAPFSRIEASVFENSRKLDRIIGRGNNTTSYHLRPRLRACSS